jgi:hypothetical protein
LSALVAIVAVGYRLVAARCRRVPSQRPRFIVGSIVILSIAGLLVPWVLAKLNPPWSESPAGIFVYLGKALLVFVPGLLALGGLAGAIVQGGSSGSDSAARS